MLLSTCSTGSRTVLLPLYISKLYLRNTQTAQCDANKKKYTTAYCLSRNRTHTSLNDIYSEVLQLVLFVAAKKRRIKTTSLLRILRLYLSLAELSFVSSRLIWLLPANSDAMQMWELSMMLWLALANTQNIGSCEVQLYMHNIIIACLLCCTLELANRF